MRDVAGLDPEGISTGQGQPLLEPKEAVDQDQSGMLTVAGTTAACAPTHTGVLVLTSRKEKEMQSWKEGGKKE